MYFREKLRFSDEEIQRAGSVNILDYVSQLGLEPVKVSASSYKIPEYGGLYIDAEGKRWNHFSENAGGSVIQLAMHLEKKSWVEAVRQLLDQDGSIGQVAHLRKSEEAEERGEFILPEKNKTYKHMFAYLIGHRKIDKDVVYDLVKANKLYENSHGACVFVGHDSEGNARYASVRSTRSEGRVFRGDVKNSDKSFGFNIEGNTKTLKVFESPIDLMSLLTITKPHEKLGIMDHYISLGGVSDKALERYLNEHPEVKRINVCLDNDNAGRAAYHQIYSKYHKDYTVYSFFPRNKDWNEDLVKGVYGAKKQETNEAEEEEELEL